VYLGQKHVDYDRAVFQVEIDIFPKKRSSRVHAESIHISPLHIFVSYSTPTTPADRQSLSLELNVNFNIAVPTYTLPRIPATLHNLEPPVPSSSVNPAFKTLQEATVE
jgi:hypothetical protein